MANIYLRRSTMADLDEIMAVINEAKELLRKDGNSQWQNGYPNRKVFTDDINNNINWVLMVNGKVAGTATIYTEPEDTYNDLHGGNWGRNGKYATLHRIAISNQFRGYKLGTLMFSNLITISSYLGFDDIRLDTSPVNERMQGLATKFGFKKRGIIKGLDENDPNRYAYELDL